MSTIKILKKHIRRTKHHSLTLSYFPPIDHRACVKGFSINSYTGRMRSYGCTDSIYKKGCNDWKKDGRWNKTFRYRLSQSKKKAIENYKFHCRNMIEKMKNEYT